MRFFRESREARVARLKEWRRWFAWHPVEVLPPEPGRGAIVWLETVERRAKTVLAADDLEPELICWEYRLLPSGGGSFMLDPSRTEALVWVDRATFKPSVSATLGEMSADSAQRVGQTPSKEDAFWPHEHGSVEQAAYEIRNALTRGYAEQWLKELQLRCQDDFTRQVAAVLTDLPPDDACITRAMVTVRGRGNS